MTERLPFHFSLSCIGEGNASSPLQCSCLENPRDGGAWWAAVYGVAQSRTRLKRRSSSSSSGRQQNRRELGKARDLFKKIRDTKGNFHAKMVSIKDRNGMYGPDRNGMYGPYRSSRY